MAVPIGVLHHDHHSRPALQRARSHSSPTQNEVPTLSVDNVLRPKRPQHVRAHSLLSPGSTLPQDAVQPRSSLERPEKQTTEKHHRIHLPGRSHTQRNSLDGDAQRRRSKLHRYTQSLADHHHHTNSHAHHNTANMHAARMKRRADLHADSTAHDSLPNLVAGLNAERNRAHHRGNAPPTDSSTVTTTAPSLQRVMSNRSYRGLAAADGLHYAYDAPLQRPNDLRRRATSDPRYPQFDSALGHPVPSSNLRPKTSIELDLERADRLARQKRFTLTTTDIKIKDTQIAAAEAELRESLQQISHRGMEITRRLDYGFYNLLEKVGNLASVIHSFQTLAHQSRQLITNLEQESTKTDENIRHRTKKLQEGFDEREQRIVALEQRQKEVVRRAEELGERLERARNRVENWEKREIERQEVWGRFWGRVWWGLAAVVVLVVGLLLAKSAYRAGSVDVVRAAGDVVVDGAGARQGSGGRSAGIEHPPNRSQEDLHEAMERVPDHVKSVLVEIEQRQQQSQSQSLSSPSRAGSQDGSLENMDAPPATRSKPASEPPPLRVLDDL